MGGLTHLGRGAGGAQRGRAGSVQGGGGRKGWSSKGWGEGVIGSHGQMEATTREGRNEG